MSVSNPSCDTVHALNAVKAYAVAVGSDSEPLDTQIRDLMTDLRLLCRERGLDFHDAVTTSYSHYLTEIGYFK